MGLTPIPAVAAATELSTDSVTGSSLLIPATRILERDHVADEDAAVFEAARQTLLDVLNTKY